MKAKHNAISDDDYMPDLSTLTFRHNGNNSMLIYVEQYFNVPNPKALVENTSNAAKPLMEFVKSIGKISDYEIDIHQIIDNGVLARITLIGKEENLLISVISEFSSQLCQTAGYNTLEKYFEIIKSGIKTKWKDVLDKIVKTNDENE